MCFPCQQHNPALHAKRQKGRHRQLPNNFTNISAMCLQEGKSDIEFLREEELVNGLHVSSRSYKPITCYQISPKGKVSETEVCRFILDLSYCISHTTYLTKSRQSCTKRPPAVRIGYSAIRRHQATSAPIKSVSLTCVL